MTVNIYVQRKKPTPRPFSHPLFGCDLKTLIRLRLQNGPIAFPYRLQWFGILASAAVRSPFTIVEKFAASRAINRMPPMQPPLFIVGHWRSGTTHLCNILSQSPRFGFISPFAVGLPWNFLKLAKWIRPFLEKMLPANRFVDRMKVSPESAQEDEFGLASMQTISFLHGWYFPNRFSSNFYNGIFLDRCSAEEVEGWKKAHKYYLQKISLDQNGKQLVVKNPAYTSRIPMLKELWPGAKFIHIYRNPYRVFQSMRRLHVNLLSTLSMQDYAHLKIEPILLNTYSRMMDRLIEDAKDLKAEEFVEIRYEDLNEQPLKQLEKAYQQLGLDRFDKDRKHFSAYLNTVKKYKKNMYDQSEEDRELIQEHWHRYINHWGY